MKNFIAAVSGGPDSMALLEMYKKKIIAVCHVNYHDREDTDNDQQIVTQYCIKNNIELFVLDVSKQMMIDTNLKNPQSAYRKVRYDFFCKVADQLKVFNLLVAHNWNDFLETAYMQKEKKSDALFFGLKEKSQYKNIVIYRPLLKYWKDDLLNYCVKKNVHFATDYTNFANIYHRNEVRKIINGFSKEKLKEFTKEVLEHNKKNKDFNNEIIKEFIEWKKTNYSLKWFKQEDSKFYYYLIFLFLSKNNINKITRGKIEGVISFIISNNKKTLYRLKENVFLVIENNLIKIIQQ